MSWRGWCWLHRRENVASWGGGPQGNLTRDTLVGVGLAVELAGGTQDTLQPSCLMVNGVDE